jgi:hypothetical protein
MAFESNLIPILREGIEIVKMILFKQLKTYLSQKYPDDEIAYINKLAAAIVNDLFGAQNKEVSFALFAEENKDRTAEEISNLAGSLGNLRIPLTDALRAQFLCDHHEGIDSSSVLLRAKEHGILIADREVPLPAQFVSLVRRLGGAHNILVV